jgi:iron complex transport system permease protein
MYLFSFTALFLSILISLFFRLDFSQAHLIITELRLPRLILAIAVGGALSVSGVVMQSTLSNPLADPYSLGVASGAALGAALFNSYSLSLGAILGALLIVFLLLKLMQKNKTESEALVLMGVMLSLTCASFLAIWMAISDPHGVQSLNFWLLGDLSRGSMMPANLLLLLSLVMSGYFFSISTKLNAFLFGLNQVESFGVNKNKIQKTVIILVSVLVGLCVSTVGMIGFIGLVVPHFVRKLIKTSMHEKVIPLSFLVGAAALVLSDVLAKTIADPYELPVGAVAAVVGAPTFIYLFIKTRRVG